MATDDVLLTCANDAPPAGGRWTPRKSLRVLLAGQRCMLSELLCTRVNSYDEYLDVLHVASPRTNDVYNKTLFRDSDVLDLRLEGSCC